MVFARIVHLYSPTRKVWLFSPSSLALVFVTLDTVSFVIQLVGCGMAGLGASPESQKKGLDIYIGSIGMQKGFIILFLSLVIKFRRDQLQAGRVGRLTANKIFGWKWLIWALYACLLAITIRILYRLVEFPAGLGHDNPLPSNEPLLYVPELTPMWLAILVWNIVHPGRFIVAKMPRCSPRGSLAISAAAGVNVAATTAMGGLATSELTTAWQTIRSWRTTKRCILSRRVTEVVLLPPESTFFWMYYLATLLRTALPESSSAFAQHQLPTMIA